MLFLFNRNKFAQLIIDVISRVSFARRALLNQLPQSTNDFLILQEKKERTPPTPPPCVGAGDVGCQGRTGGLEEKTGRKVRGRGGDGGLLGSTLGSLGGRPGVGDEEETAKGARRCGLGWRPLRVEGSPHSARGRGCSRRLLWSPSSPQQCVRACGCGPLASPTRAGVSQVGGGKAPPRGTSSDGSADPASDERLAGRARLPQRPGSEHSCCLLVNRLDAGWFNFVDKSVRWGWGPGGGRGGGVGREGCCFFADLFLTRGCTSP